MFVEFKVTVEQVQNGVRGMSLSTESRITWTNALCKELVGSCLNYVSLVVRTYYVIDKLEIGGLAESLKRLNLSRFFEGLNLSVDEGVSAIALHNSMKEVLKK